MMVVLSDHSDESETMLTQSVPEPFHVAPLLSVIILPYSHCTWTRLCLFVYCDYECTLQCTVQYSVLYSSVYCTVLLSS